MTEVWEKKVTIGLGTAVRRMMVLDRQYRDGLATPAAKVERDLLVEALDQYPVHVVMDCKRDDVEEADIEIFAKSAESSCCRPRSYEPSRRAPSARPTEAGVNKLTRRSA
jgi:hypothetical protein